MLARLRKAHFTRAACCVYGAEHTGSFIPRRTIETHIAEKRHAYTMPRSRPNSRVKDLPGLTLVASAQELDAQRSCAAFEQTFAFRKTHAPPAAEPPPIDAWRKPYEAMAREGTG